MGDTEDDEENSDRNTDEDDEQSTDETNRRSTDETDQQREQPSEMRTSLSLDAVLELLANHDRRRIIDYLLDASGQTATVDELVDHLVARKTELTGERPGHDHVLATLHHVHVPKLADAGVVEYDPRSRQLRYWGNERLERWHRRIRDDEGGSGGRGDEEDSDGRDEEDSDGRDDEDGSGEDRQDGTEGSTGRDAENGPAEDELDDATGDRENDSDRDQGD